MKKLIIATLALAVLTAPAFAGGRGHGHHSRGNDHGLGVKAGVSTGKGGLIGTLLGRHGRHGSNGLGVKIGVNTGKGGVLGALLGGGRGGRGHGHGHGW